MPLSCHCDCDLDEWAWASRGPSEIHSFNSDGSYKIRKRCASCGQLINFGDECIKFDRIRSPISDYERSRFGSEIYLSPIFHCAHCAEIFMTLYERGYTCIDPSENVMRALQAYWDLTGFDPKKYTGVACDTP